MSHAKLQKLTKNLFLADVSRDSHISISEYRHVSHEIHIVAQCPPDVPHETLDYETTRIEVSHETSIIIEFQRMSHAKRPILRLRIDRNFANCTANAKPIFWFEMRLIPKHNGWQHFSDRLNSMLANAKPDVHISNERDQYKNIKNHKHNGTRNDTKTTLQNAPADSKLRPIDKRNANVPPPFQTRGDDSKRPPGAIVWKARSESSEGTSFLYKMQLIVSYTENEVPKAKRKRYTTRQCGFPLGKPRRIPYFALHRTGQHTR